ncbi:MAG: hypothetical protein EBS17_03075 [Flavobacteriia bacterium]|nr:hypothetical protein [Flavobacteriia bacterium]
MKVMVLCSVMLLLNSCVSVNYVNGIIPITQKHHAIAVLPPRVTLERKIWMSDDHYKEITLKKQTHLHAHLNRSFNRRVNEGRCFVEVLDPSATAYLAFSDDFNQGRVSSKELCKLLNVDAVFEFNMQILEPVSEFTALFFQETTGATLITNQVILTASLTDSLSNAPLFTLSTSKIGTLGSIKQVMVNKVIRRATRNTPYNLKKNPYRKLYNKYLKQ